MKNFSALQIKEWDAFTIANEPVSALNLMERAATSCYNWLLENNFLQLPVYIFCGKGNNGGDGLVIARLLMQNKFKVKIYILESAQKGSEAFEINLQKLQKLTLDINSVSLPETFPVLPNDIIIIDALFGTGLNKPLQDNAAALVNHINQSKATVIAIDIPSGLAADYTSKGNAIIHATHTLSFQQYKLAFLLAENEEFCGVVHILNINLHKQFQATIAAFEWVDQSFIQSIYKPRKKFTHKGTYGHAALICGSYGMMGAAVLSAGGCLRSGSGKLTCFIPGCGYPIIQTAVPEAMCIVNGAGYITAVNDINKFDAIGIGPGIGLHTSHHDLLKNIFSALPKALVLDADALNIISQQKELLSLIPKNTILTPHLKEFERVFGSSANDFERIQLALEKSKQYHIYIVLKGNCSFISTPEGTGYFNSTGNPGMATAGSGDVLTGIITSLLAQSYTPLQACLLGVYIHGSAGDIAATQTSQEAMIAEDITAHLGKAFRLLQ
jgi:NAD(P)H-hydrate epimerase